MSEVQSPPGYLVSWAREGPSVLQPPNPSYEPKRNSSARLRYGTNPRLFRRRSLHFSGEHFLGLSVRRSLVDEGDALGFRFGFDGSSVMAFISKGPKKERDESRGETRGRKSSRRASDSVGRLWFFSENGFGFGVEGE
ncbi:hypothetical protein L1049_002808 [Liquidambar formosana]|uniref:Uncharacterized protein n=1 Tax=Liquidambar formosana TaxID=63359 RepID=A0AAP0NIR6_LIQFO